MDGERPARIRLTLLDRTVRLKDLLPIIEEYPDAEILGSDLHISVGNPIDPIPQPVTSEQWDAYSYVEAAKKLCLHVSDREILALRREFLQRRAANETAGDEHNRWSFDEQERLQRLLDGGEEP